MKTLLRNSFLAFGMLAASGFTLVRAQSSVEHALKANVPFAFRVQNQSLAPGQYRLRVNANTYVTAIQNNKPGCTIIVGSHGVNTVKMNAPKMVFHKYGETYFLAEIWDESGTSRGVPVSTQEKEIVRNQPSLAMIPVSLNLAD